MLTEQQPSLFTDTKSDIIGGPFCRFEYQPMNLNSHEQVKSYLLTQGWQPTTFTPGGSPQLSEDSFESVTGDLPSLLTRRAVVMHRKRLLDSVKKDGSDGGLLSFVRDDGRIEARAITNGTPTARAIHSQIVNIPAVGTAFGEEFRGLFIVPEGYLLAGVDAQALEGRIMAHFVLNYPGGDAIAEILLNGDVHQVNADLWGCTRKEAKSPFYALNFGAQPKKLAQTMGVSEKRAKQVYNDFWSFYKPLELFKNDLVSAWEKRGGNKGGFLKGLDGRKLFARSPHSLVNLMIQSSGSIVVKTAMCFIDNAIKKGKIDAVQVGWFHDELQIEVKSEQAGLLKLIAEKSFLKAGEFHKIKVPMPGECKLGINWALTH